MTEPRMYNIYKGLQRPLVFKSFKGKFIYWAVGAILAGIVAGGMVGAFVNSIVGIVVMILVSVPGLVWVLNKQKGGLYSKKKNHEIFIIKPIKIPYKNEP